MTWLQWLNDLKWHCMVTAEQHQWSWLGTTSVNVHLQHNSVSLSNHMWRPRCSWPRLWCLRWVGHQVLNSCCLVICCSQRGLCFPTRSSAPSSFGGHWSPLCRDVKNRTWWGMFCAIISGQMNLSRLSMLWLQSSGAARRLQREQTLWCKALVAFVRAQPCEVLGNPYK